MDLCDLSLFDRQRRRGGLGTESGGENYSNSKLGQYDGAGSARNFTFVLCKFGTERDQRTWEVSSLTMLIRLAAEVN